ncbi:MAG TPA: universal stress protein [Candidatus Sulfotelmatobacter sp.]|nr:universal stress protein [Candidatus Sulfotelmatobacter sp.]
MTVAELNTPLKSATTSVAFRTILVATDFSEPSRRALCEALALAAQHHAQLSVIHVLHPHRRRGDFENPAEVDGERIAAETQIEALMNELRPQEKVGVLIKQGDAALQVLSVIEEQKVDLLVMGTRGLGGLRKLALGSVADELLRVAPCPVLTIGPKAEVGAVSRGARFHHILFATDFGKGSTKALPLALALARAEQAQLILLHMIPPVPSSSASLSAYAPAAAAADEVAEWEGKFHKQALQQLKECLPRETGLSQEVKYVVGSDFLTEGILNASAKFNVDLIVMGASRATSARVAAHLPWAAVHEVLRDAPCPVLTVAG